MAPRVRFSVEPGQVFGRLTVLRDERCALTPGRARHGFTTGLRGARCACACGVELVVSLTNLRNGSAQSCGCLRTEVASARTAAMSEANTVHGLTGHPLYKVWRGMLARCYNDAHRWYHRYGGRGITVCPEWRDPAVFVREITDLIGDRPEGTTLDRIDNDGAYEPGNVRWATQAVQVRNRSLGDRKALPVDVRAEMSARRSSGETLASLATAYGVSIATAHRYVQQTDRLT